MLTDFIRVYNFLQETYDPITLNSFLLPQYFEYAHTHREFNPKLTHRFGLWEENDQIVGIACYEMDLGEVHLHYRKGYGFLLPELLDWAENELYTIKDGQRELRVWITDREPDKRQLLQNEGYELTRSHELLIFDYQNEFVIPSLPEGFALIDGMKVDYQKLHACFWKGFNRGDTPDDNVDCRVHNFNAPHFDLSLMKIVVAPNGEYACALGMWFDEKNKYAYLEPLATVPEYRRLGLATIALMEAMKKTKGLGATFCFGGWNEFYPAIGFEKIGEQELWSKSH